MGQVARRHRDVAIPIGEPAPASVARGAEECAAVCAQISPEARVRAQERMRMQMRMKTSSQDGR